MPRVGDVVELVSPDFPLVVGQGPLPAGIRYGQTFIPWGSKMKVSDRCRFPANLDAPQPLIHIDLADDIAGQLRTIKPA